ncbi:MAG: uracil-DNA glycosylase, partial [Clostridia bacterium]|nr:uracil-DNA glycosylase [Clostridia bacterium]
LKKEYATYTVYPKRPNIYKCFQETPYKDVKVVILGQDPYHEEGQAHGLSFSVPTGKKFPPSLVNIFKELKSDLGYDAPLSGDLTKWAKQGVLLLNTSLTVRQGQANSHKDCGWQWFTDEVIKILSNREEPIVFILWGANARSKKKFINLDKHFIVESAHPSPLSCYNGFWGSKPFSKTNEFLKSVNISPINWNLND